jgi:iduronate 2-sulfatase
VSMRIHKVCIGVWIPLFADNWWLRSFELGVRIPMIVRAPFLSAAVGRRSDALAEAVDLFRTVSQLAGIPIPTDNSEEVQGTSLVPAMMGHAHSNNYSYSQFAKTGRSVATAFGVCMGCYPTTNEGPTANYMGYTVRSSEWRWTEWFAWDGDSGEPTWAAGPVATELYDHRLDHGDDFDSFENVNMHNETEAAAAAARSELSKVLRRQFQGDELEV